MEGRPYHESLFAEAENGGRELLASRLRRKPLCVESTNEGRRRRSGTVPLEGGSSLSLSDEVRFDASTMDF